MVETIAERWATSEKPKAAPPDDQRFADDEDYADDMEVA
jgi:hypothetical protein